MKFIAIKIEDGQIKGKLAFYCRMLHVSRQGFYNYLKARATHKGFSTPTPSMKGDSCLLELGWQVKPKETSPLSINLNLTGWCGKQKGVQFGAGFEWGF